MKSDHSRALLAVAAVLILGTIGWLLFQMLYLRSQYNQVVADLAQLSQVQQPPAETVATFLLSPGNLRDASAVKRLRIPSQTDLVRFELQIPAGARFIAPSKSYRVVLREPEGVEAGAGKSPETRVPGIP